MIRVGLTGGIGSGKSTVAKIMESLGVPVYNSDERSKSILETDPLVISKVQELIGEEAYKNGIPDRKYIAGKVFNDASLLGKLNGIMHPAVRLDFMSWASQHSDSPYIVMEAAILIESGFGNDMDKIIVVTAPEEIRIERAAKRDGTDIESIRKRVEAQMAEEERLPAADYILYADEEHLLVPQVLELDKKLRALRKANFDCTAID